MSTSIKRVRQIKRFTTTIVQRGHLSGRQVGRDGAGKFAIHAYAKKSDQWIINTWAGIERRMVITENLKLLQSDDRRVP